METPYHIDGVKRLFVSGNLSNQTLVEDLPWKLVIHYLGFSRGRKTPFFLTNPCAALELIR